MYALQHREIYLSILLAIILKINYHSVTMKLTTAQQMYANALSARKEKILSLRRNGFTWQEIGDKLGISRQRAHQIWKKAKT